MVAEIQTATELHWQACIGEFTLDLVSLVSLDSLDSLVSFVWIGWGDTELRSSMRTLAKRHVTRKPFFRRCRAKIMPGALQVVQLMSKFLQRLKHVDLDTVKSKCLKFLF